ncbi:MAG: ribosome biogenesis GTPase Der [Gammaproteobacteria bacterium]|nr:ribosome biogenesis GTPase Der [Gammaproteobacteria bacterium]MDE0413057.1 ribosome biogenesis GTPase Der [Gammaproteobacteria bacterium]
MLPVVALTGRPNVGKSTLFNRLAGKREALVADYPGLTRDRRHCLARLDGRRVILVDTPGVGEGGDWDEALRGQFERALAESDLAVLLTDARQGLCPADEAAAGWMREAGCTVILAVNKSEGQPREISVAEFHALGIPDPFAISALRGDGVASLADAVAHALPADATTLEADEGRTRIAIIGRPNVGKSTLVNRYLGEERMLVRDQAGTTRDSVPLDFEYGGEPCTLVDTAGIRRRTRVDPGPERLSVTQALQAIEQADAVIVLLDAREGATEQDLRLISLALDRGRALVIGANQWDRVPASGRARLNDELARQLKFLDFVDLHRVSALRGWAVNKLLDSALAGVESASRDLPTGQLNAVLRRAVEEHATPRRGGRRIRLNYAHQGGKRPPLIVIHGRQTEHLPASFRRYLARRVRTKFGLRGTPVRIELRTGSNPYAESSV